MQKKIIKPFFLIKPRYIYIKFAKKIFRPHAQNNPHSYQTHYIGMDN